MYKTSTATTYKPNQDESWEGATYCVPCLEYEQIDGVDTDGNPTYCMNWGPRESDVYEDPEDCANSDCEEIGGGDEWSLGD